MDRRSFVGSVAATAALTTQQGTPAPRAAQRPTPFALEDVPIATLQEWMTSGRTTARRLVDQYAARIAALDQRGPRLGHVLEINPDARAVAVGTETSGSIISPSSACGCVGIKPTVGLVSRAGIIPISHSQDTAGPIARTVADAAALLTALAGADPPDEATAEAAQHATDFTRALDADRPRGARGGLLRPAPAPAGAPAGGNIDARILALYEAAIAVLRQRGADLVDPVTLTVQLPNGGDPLPDEFKAHLE